MTTNIGDYVSAYKLGTLYQVQGVITKMSPTGKVRIASVGYDKTVIAEHPNKKSEEWLPDYERKFVAIVRSKL